MTQEKRDPETIALLVEHGGHQLAFKVSAQSCLSEAAKLPAYARVVMFSAEEDSSLGDTCWGGHIPPKPILPRVCTRIDW